MVNLTCLKPMPIDGSALRAPTLKPWTAALFLCINSRSQKQTHNSLFTQRLQAHRNESDSFFLSFEWQRTYTTGNLLPLGVKKFPDAVRLEINAGTRDNVTTKKKKKKKFPPHLGSASASTTIIYAEWPKAEITGSPSASISVTHSFSL